MLKVKTTIFKKGEGQCRQTALGQGKKKEETIYKYINETLSNLSIK